ncbi:ATP-binding protein [Halosquirtibacter xylanolyticus]|uniref:nucleotide-binding protein n=1 Tax=Halosquirtibacter xylanolyticus TaxID=3374599 RepID=UPI003748D7B4|nr:ATP-binding protein [Prolixibacteraceae bacterium]
MSSFKIAIASGKGGVGKTTLSVLLYHQLQKAMNETISLVDCDVEEPNSRIFFPSSTQTKQEVAIQEIPAIDTERCTFCRKCVDVCEFNAIMMVGALKHAEVNESLCHSCGACEYVCDQHALGTKRVAIGLMTQHQTPLGSLYEGRLEVGSVMQTRLIGMLKEWGPSGHIAIYDAPPGTSCSVVETLDEMDYVVLVAEETSFGLHDLKLIIRLVKALQIPFGVVINKAGLGSTPLKTYLQQQQVELLGEIPHSIPFAKASAKADIFDSMPSVIQGAIETVAQKIKHKRVEV